MTTTPNFRALCAELVKRLDELNCNFDIPSQSALIECANDALATPPPEPPTDEELDELSWNWYSKTGSTWWQIDSYRAFARAVLERWGRASRDDDDCISPQDLHDIACSLREGRKGLSKHIIYFQDEGKDKGIGVWAKNEEEAEILAMETYAQFKKACAT